MFLCLRVWNITSDGDNMLEAIIIGLVQGLTEFLPVSSSGHLVLFQKIFGFEEPALLFDTMLHAGTLIAVFVVLWNDIWAIIKKPIQPLTAYLILATVPTVIFALAFRKSLERIFETGEFLGFCFLITSILLATAELLFRRSSGTLKKNGEMNWLDAIVIGIMQAIAILPGVSRSGATLSGALSRKLNRDFAARFSFLLSIPAILGATVFHFKDLLKGGKVMDGGIGTEAMLAGTITAAIVGFFAVRFMLKIIREKSLWGFVIYTGILGLLVLIDQFAVHLMF
jgi:undecaprenyl-diphosphatase